MISGRVVGSLRGFSGQLPVVVGAFLLVVILAQWWLSAPRRPNLPVLRVSKRPGRLGKMDDISMYLTDNERFLQIGYDRYSKKGQHFIVELPAGRWEVIVAPQFLEEIRRAPESYVNNQSANMETMQFKWTLHEKLAHDQYHMDIPIRKSLTQSLGPRLPDIVEEGALSLDDNVGVAKDWTAVNITKLSFAVITRTANRVLFGIDLARNAEFTDLSVKHTVTLFGGANLIRHYPNFLKPLIVWWKTGVYEEQKTAHRLLDPILSQRLATEDRYKTEDRQEEWEKVKPQDAMQWILDVTPPEERRLDRLVLRMLNMNIAAIHTSSVTFLDSMILLALSPEIHDDLREEIERVFTAEGGWTKQALTYLMKVDSMITEAMRVTGGQQSIKMTRRVIKDWKMSDGTVLPKGTRLNILSWYRLRDPDFMPDAAKFDPYRMYKRRQQPDKANQYQFVMTGEHNMHFGHGVHACPGRFFATNEIKTLMAAMLMRYEIRMNLDGGIPAAIKGRRYGYDREPISEAMLELKDRRHKIPEHLKKFF